MNFRIIKIREFRDLRDNHNMKISCHGNMIGITRLGTESPTLYMDNEKYGSLAYVSGIETIHPNVPMMWPELVEADRKLSIVSKNMADKLLVALVAMREKTVGCEQLADEAIAAFSKQDDDLLMQLKEFVSIGLNAKG